MRRIWFKPLMVERLRAGKKTTTFRKNKHDGMYAVVKGIWFNAIPIGLVVKLSPIGEMDGETVLSQHYKSEGFDTQDEAREWVKKENLALPKTGWLHTVEITLDIQYARKEA